VGFWLAAITFGICIPEAAFAPLQLIALSDSNANVDEIWCCAVTSSGGVCGRYSSSVLPDGNAKEGVGAVRRERCINTIASVGIGVLGAGGPDPDRRVIIRADAVARKLVDVNAPAFAKLGEVP
jgi:hypothetical protein